MRNADIISEIARRSGDNSSGAQSAYKLAVNSCYQELCQEIVDSYYLRRRWTLQLTEPYTTGTIAVTLDSANVTGAGTTFTAAMVGRKLIISGNNDNTAYKVLTFTDTTHITLETAYKGTTGTGLSYGIYQDIYPLADRCCKILKLTQCIIPSRVYEIEHTEFDEVMPSPISTGTPIRYKLVPPTTAPYYNTGTISANNGSATIHMTGGGTWDSTMATRVIKIVGDDNEYEILVATAASASLTTAFAGTSVTAASYEMSPRGIVQIQLHKIPDDAIQIEYEGIERPLPLLNDNDVPILPPQWQWLLVEGGFFKSCPVRDFNAGIIDRAEKRYYEGIKRMIAYGKVSQDRLVSFRFENPRHAVRNINDYNWLK